MHRNADLVLSDIAADQLALDIVGPDGLGATQDTGRIRAKYILIGAGLEYGRHVVVESVVVGDLFFIAALQVGVRGHASSLSQPLKGRSTSQNGMLLHSPGVVCTSAHLCGSDRRCSLVEHTLSLYVGNVCMVIARVGDSVAAQQRRGDSNSIQDANHDGNYSRKKGKKLNYRRVAGLDHERGGMRSARYQARRRRDGWLI